jgi:hypothetical protein
MRFAIIVDGYVGEEAVGDFIRLGSATIACPDCNSNLNRAPALICQLAKHRDVVTDPDWLETASIRTVTTRKPEWLTANVPPARSICDSVQPPKMSPLALASRGIATVRRWAPPGVCGNLSSTIALLKNHWPMND